MNTYKKIFCLSIFCVLRRIFSGLKRLNNQIDLNLFQCSISVKKDDGVVESNVNKLLRSFLFNSIAKRPLLPDFK